MARATLHTVPLSVVVPDYAAGHDVRTMYPYLYSYRYDPSIYESESKTANRNRCLTYLMAESGTFPANMESPAELMQNLEFYFKCCSIMQVCLFRVCFASLIMPSGSRPVFTLRKYVGCRIYVHHRRRTGQRRSVRIPTIDCCSLTAETCRARTGADFVHCTQVPRD